MKFPKFQFTKGDWLLVIILSIMPYLYYNGLWSRIPIAVIATLGYTFVSFLLSLILFCYFTPNKKAIIKSAIFYATTTVCIYIIFTFVRTSINTSFFYALTNFRYQFISTLTFLAIYIYISRLSINKSVHIFHFLLFFSTIQIILYFMQYAGFHIYPKEAATQIMGNIKVSRAVMGFPTVTFPVLFIISTLLYLHTQKKILLFITFLQIICAILSYTRSLLASSIITFALALLLYAMKRGVTAIYLKLFFGAMICGVVILATTPKFYIAWENLINNTMGQELKYDEGTYAFRERLIEKAQLQLKQENKELFGLGYIRDSAKGEYSFVQGTDTYIAPVIYCEGYIGLILRLIPILLLLLSALKSFIRTNNPKIYLIDICIISCILGQIPIYVQTIIFINYTEIMALLMILYTMKNKIINNLQLNNNIP